MLSQKQVALELIGKHVAAYHDSDIHKVYTDRINKARSLLEEGKVTRHKDGTYAVQGSQETPYHVNATCGCQDFLLHQAPHGWCKHRLACKLYQQVLVDLDSMRHAGIPHLHFSCDHKALLELCWEIECPEPMDQLCSHCTAALDEGSEERGVCEGTLDPEDCTGSPWPHIAEAPVGCASTLTKAELQELAAPPYECGPKKSAKHNGQRPLTVPMPEAPASLNLKIKLPGGNELMYTARSMRRGGQGDDELLARLPRILEALEALGAEESTGVWSRLRRLAHLCRLSS